MKQQVRNLQECRRLLSSGSRGETFAAVVLVLATFGPVAWQVYQAYRVWGENRA